MAKKKRTALLIVVFVLSCLFILPLVVGKINQSNKEEQPQWEQNWLTVIDTDIEWEHGAMTLNLKKGSIKTNTPVDNVFINVNGIGCTDLKYTQSFIQTTNETYYAHALTPTEDLLWTAFASDCTITVDVYIEYNGRSCKVDTQKVTMISCWTDAY